MKVIILQNKFRVSEMASSIISNKIRKNHSINLGLATGETMISFYKKIVENSKKRSIDFSRVKTFNLDEYAGVDESNKISLKNFMNKNLFRHINIKKDNIHFPNDIKKFEKDIKNAGGIDLQILGIGINGHIGFNEPGSSFKSRTRKIKLSNETLKNKSRLLKSIRKFPKYAYTSGIGTIMESKKIILLAFGKRKAEIIAKSIDGPLTEKIPASILRKHKDAIFIIDKAAARYIKN